MSRRSSKKRAGGKRPSKDEQREAARQRRQEQAARTRAAEPVLAGATGQLNLMNAGDVRMAERAIRQGWIFPDKFFETIPKRVQEAAERDGLSITAVARLTKAAAQLYGQAAAAIKEDSPPVASPTQAVNVNVGVQMNVPNSISAIPDDKLRAFVFAAGSDDGIGVEEVPAPPSANGVLPAFATPSTNGVSGKH